MRAGFELFCAGRCGGRPRLHLGAALAGLLAGALGAYFLDPDRGRVRRRRVRDRGTALRRRSVRTLRARMAVARGRARRVVHRLARRPVRELDDATLVAKVESTVFRDPRMPKGRVSINAEQGTVVLRGQLESHQLIEELERVVRAVAGVHAVESLLHLPGTPAPHRPGGALLRSPEQA